MKKFSPEEKVQAVKRYLYGNESGGEIIQSIGVHHSNFHRWVKQYKTSGDEAFIKNYTTYPVQFKLDVLRYMNEHGTSVRETAAIFHIPSPESLRKWKLTYESEGSDALISKKKRLLSMKKKNQHSAKNQSPNNGSIKTLQAENKRLRMEVEYLKKLNALVQNKEKSRNNTKRK